MRVRDTMGMLKEIIAKHEINTEVGFSDAMKEVASVPEGELWFVTTAYDPEGKSRSWKMQHALAKAELDRRAFGQQKSLARTAGYFGLAGVIVGALLQTLANWALHDPCRGWGAAPCGPETVTIEGAEQ